MDNNQTGIALYEIPILNAKNMWVYLEFRAFGYSNINKYDLKYKNLYQGDKLCDLLGASSTSGVVCYLVNKDAKYPINSHGLYKNFGIEVLGGSSTNRKRTDAPQQAGSSLNISCYNEDGVVVNADIQIDILSINESGATFKVTSAALDNFKEISSEDINNDILYEKLKSYNPIVSSNSLDDYTYLDFSNSSITDISFLNMFTFAKLKYLVLCENSISNISDLKTFLTNHPDIIIILNNNKIDLTKLDTLLLESTNIFYGLQNLEPNNVTYTYYINESFSPGSYQIVFESPTEGTRSLKNKGLNTITFYKEAYKFTGYYYFTNQTNFVESFNIDFSSGFNLKSNNDSILINTEFTIPYETSLNLDLYDVSILVDDALCTKTLTDNYIFDTTGNHKITINLVNKLDSSDSYSEEYNVNIFDNVSPDVTLLGDSTVNIDYPEDYSEAGISYSDNSTSGVYSLDNKTDKLSVSIIIYYNDEIVSSINSYGSYKIVYKVSDLSFNEATCERIVNVNRIDLSIILNGDASYTIKYKTSYTDEGVNYDSRLTLAKVITHNGHEVSVIDDLGTYIITYTVTDKLGNFNSIKRTINVVDDIKPTIEEKEKYVGITYNEEGVIYYDNYDKLEALKLTIKYYKKGGALQDEIVTPGNYYAIYTVIDTSGNEESIRRDIEIIDVNDCIDSEIESITVTTRFLDVNHEEVSDVSNLEAYFIEYTVTDKYGNKKIILREKHNEIESSSAESISQGESSSSSSSAEESNQESSTDINNNASSNTRAAEIVIYVVLVVLVVGIIIVISKVVLKKK